jgi:hypothetical protein
LWISLRVVIIAAGCLLFANYGLGRLGSTLIYHGKIERSQAILIENFDPDYLLFEKTHDLLREGWARRVLVPVKQGDDGHLGAVPKGFVDVMARVARLPEPEMIPTREVEPISLNTARQVLDYLKKENLRSVIIVSSGFRSQRDFLIWDSVLRPAGIHVSCQPVFGERTSENWRVS